MHAPSLLGAWLLVWLFVVLPRAAWRSRRVLDAARGSPHARTDPDARASAPEITRARILTGTLLVLGLTFAIAWAVARELELGLFAHARLGPRELLLGAAALALLLALRLLARVGLSREQRLRRRALAWLPRTRGEWVLFAATSVAAGIAEEAAYRGMAVVVLEWVLGSRLLAIALSALAFAAGHLTQELRSVLVIFALALVLQGLVELTDTLVVAMVVHALYDLLAGWLAREDVRVAARG